MTTNGVSYGFGFIFFHSICYYVCFFKARLGLHPPEVDENNDRGGSDSGVQECVVAELSMPAEDPKIKSN